MESYFLLLLKQETDLCVYIFQDFLGRLFVVYRLPGMFYLLCVCVRKATQMLKVYGATEIGTCYRLIY